MKLCDKSISDLNVGDNILIITNQSESKELNNMPELTVIRIFDILKKLL